MAVIQKIRDKYAKLAGGLIALALIAFIITSASESNIGRSIKELFGGKASYVVKIDGEKVDQKEYIKWISNYETLYEIFSKGRTMDEATRAQLHDEAVKQIIYQKLVSEELDKLSIEVSKEEENESIKGANPDPLIKQFPYFQDPKTGQFDPNALAAFEAKKLDMSNPNAVKALEQWDIVKDYVKRNHKVQKFNSLITAGVYEPKFVIARQSKDQNMQADIQYVKIPFTTINDNEVKVTDNDVQEYLKKHAAQYTIDDPTRTIEYVSFDEYPSANDTAKVMDAMMQVKNDFATATNMEAFVGRNSDEPYVDAYVSKRSFNSVFADSILKQPVGAIVGPYFENGSYKLTKVVDKKVLPDSVKCRHILIKTEDAGQAKLSDTVAKQRIDSIANAIKNGADFKAMVLKYSDDDGSKNTNGEYDFTLEQRAQLSKEFADFIFDGKTGEKKIVKVSNSNYSGYHYIEIISQKAMEPAEKLATVSKALMVSAETDQNIYSKATEFAGKNTTAAAFDAAAKKENLNKRIASNIKVNDFTVEGLGASREIIRWAYDAKVGDVSGIFKLDNRYIVAKLTETHDKGLMTPDANTRTQIEASIRTEKKAQLIKTKYKSATSLETIAQSAGQQVQHADSFNANSTFIPNVGPAPKVVGYAFNNNFKTNTLSPGLNSGDGVFYIVVLNRREMPSKTDDAMMAQQARQMEMQMKGNVGNGVMETLRKNADIKYNAEMLY